MGQLDERHHTFIQALMSRGPLSEQHAMAIFNDLCREEPGGFSHFLASVNKEMNFLQLEVRAGRNQYDGKLYYGLVNKLGNEQAKLGTRYSHAQISFFKAVLEAIISDTSLKGEISGIQALNLRLDIQNEQQQPGETSTQMPLTGAMHLSLAQKEKTLEELAHDHWLSHTPGGMVALGVRSFLELWNVFKNYDVPICDVCNEAGIKAQACRNEDCSVRMHDYCLKRRFHRAQIPRVCPKCGTDWDGGTGQVSQSGPGTQRNSEESDLLVLKRPRSSPGTQRNPEESDLPVLKRRRSGPETQRNSEESDLPVLKRRRSGPETQRNSEESDLPVLKRPRSGRRRAWSDFSQHAVSLGEE